jgi:hypothetical protein
MADISKSTITPNYRKEKAMKQIEEIRKDIFAAFGGYAKWEEDWESLAEAVYNAGYRKQSEVAKEIFDEIEKIINDDRINRKLAELGLCYVRDGESTFEERIDELKKKYTEGENELD